VSPCGAAFASTPPTTLPRAVIRAILEEFTPHDDHSREAMPLFVA
jgi:hypothetical protein